MMTTNPTIRAATRAAVLGSAFLNCHPTPRYQEKRGNKKLTAPMITNSMGISLNMNIPIRSPSIKVKTRE